MKKNLLFFFVIFFLSTLPSQAYIYFNIDNPKTGTWQGPGTVRNVQITVFPRGVYAEIGLTFEVLGEGSTYYNSTDTLEATLNFSLPDKSLVIDSWLWIDDTTIVKAQHLDRWTATSIYENIVKRVRKDPSLLTKYGNYYTMKIYPLMGYNTPRKAKITYLAPIAFKDGKASIPMPVDFANASASVSGFTLKMFESGDYKQPRADGYSLPHTQLTENGLSSYTVTFNSNLANAQNSNYNYYYYYGYNSKPVYPSFDVAYNTSSNVKFSYFPKNEEEGFFELAFNPSGVLNTPQTKRVCLVMDYDHIYSSTSRTKLAEEATKFLKGHLDSTDYFNVVFAGNTIRRNSNLWMSAKDQSIDNALSDTSFFMSDTTGQENLFNNVVDFINSQDSSARIVVLTSNIKRYKADSALNMVNRIVASMKHKTPIDIIDHYYFYYYNKTGNTAFVPYEPYTMLNGINYYGNAFFYINLCKKTGGNFYEARKSTYGHYTWYTDYNYNNSYVVSSIRSNLTQIGSFLIGQFTAFDFQVSLQNGFVYGKYFLSKPGTDKVSPESGYVMVGQYKGTFPLKLQTSGLLGGKVYSNQIELEATESNKENNILERHWWGQYILSNENTYQTQIISDVVDAALKYRILSNYTAFLCLEPSLGGTVCKDCVDGVPYTSGNGNYDLFTTGIQEETSSEVIAEIYPNPASEYVTFRIKNPKAEALYISVYNATGSIVKEIKSTNYQQSEEIVWHLTDESGSKVPSGFYYVTIRVGKSFKTIKLIIN